MTNPTLTYWKYNIGAVISLAAMYGAYVRWSFTDANLFSLSVGVLGAVFGFLVSKGSTVKSEFQIERILSTALIKEKEEEVKTVEEAKKLYQEELKRLKAIIEDEGNRLLLRRLREVYIDDIKEKLQSIDAIEKKLKQIETEAHTTEILELRKQIDVLLLGVRNPEEDERIIKQICYSLPILGNSIYLIYLLAKMISPNLQEKVHSQIYRIKEAEFKLNNIMLAVLFLIMIMAAGVTIIK